jgi:hypothetical protein
MAHGLDKCEVSMMIPFNPMEPWSGSIIDNEPDTSVERMAHIALTSLWEGRLTTIATLPITLLPIWNQENHIWQQRLEAVSDLKSPHFHAGMTSLATYAPYMFNLQYNAARTGMQQRTCLMGIRRVSLPPPMSLRGWGMIMPSSIEMHIHRQSRIVSYRRFTVVLAMLSICWITHVCCSTSLVRRWRPIPMGLSTLSTTVGLWATGGAKHEERVEMIADLEQQLLVLQGQAPPEPADHEEIDVVSDIDED